MLAPLLFGQVTVRETLAVKEHLYDPKDLVADVNVRLFHFVFFVGLRLLELLEVFLC